MGFDFKVNGKAVHSDAPSLTPLLWVISARAQAHRPSSLRVSWMIRHPHWRSLCDRTNDIERFCRTTAETRGFFRQGKLVKICTSKGLTSHS